MLKFRICFGAIFLATLAVTSATFERSSPRENSDNPLGLKIEPAIVSLLTGLLTSLTVSSQLAMLNCFLKVYDIYTVSFCKDI